jgi:hypothetical protein
LRRPAEDDPGFAVPARRLRRLIRQQRNLILVLHQPPLEGLQLRIQRSSEPKVPRASKALIGGQAQPPLAQAEALRLLTAPPNINHNRPGSTRMGELAELRTQPRFQKLVEGTA